MRRPQTEGSQEKVQVNSPRPELIADVPGPGWKGPDVAGLNFEFKGLVDAHASMPPGIPPMPQASGWPKFLFLCSQRRNGRS